MSTASRVELVLSLLDDNVYDDDGNVIGKQEPLIDADMARKLLGFPELLQSPTPAERPNHNDG
jgi:hypothetical protein